MFKLLNGKKGLIAIALMMAGIIGLPLAAQYYQWKVEYNITPLTSDYMSITILATSGATNGTYTDTRVPNITITKRAVVHFRIESDDLNEIHASFYDLKIDIYGNNTLLATLHPEVAGSKASAPYDVQTRILDPGLYDIDAVVTYWTGAVTNSVQDSITIEVYAVEEALALA